MSLLSYNVAMSLNLQCCGTPGSYLVVGGPSYYLTMRADSLWVEWVWLHSATDTERNLSVAVDTLHQPRNTATINYQCLQWLVVQ